MTVTLNTVRVPFTFLFFLVDFSGVTSSNFMDSRRAGTLRMSPPDVGLIIIISVVLSSAFMMVSSVMSPLRDWKE